MDEKSYKKLVKDCPVFRDFSDEFKARLLNARGEDMGRYAKMLEGANTAMAAAQRDMTERNERALMNFKEGIRRVEKEKNEFVESKVRKEESASGKSLLEELKKIN